MMPESNSKILTGEKLDDGPRELDGGVGDDLCRWHI